ncbi:hypothetical protein [Nodosilinea nodulosa]|uniref:hypothetical protein n=1 Tax=Nodosilinea nodulosa TaxID=416001 RepID=UPI0003814A81|nr:hypothetical protein [Nodosilinea nodulosa]
MIGGKRMLDGLYSIASKAPPEGMRGLGGTALADKTLLAMMAEGHVKPAFAGPALGSAANFAGSALMSTPGGMAMGIGATLGAQSILDELAKSKARQQMEATAQLNPANMGATGMPPEMMFM